MALLGVGAGEVHRNWTDHLRAENLMFACSQISHAQWIEYLCDCVRAIGWPRLAWLSLLFLGQSELRPRKSSVWQSIETIIGLLYFCSRSLPLLAAQIG